MSSRSKAETFVEWGIVVNAMACPILSFIGYTVASAYGATDPGLILFFGALWFFLMCLLAKCVSDVRKEKKAKEKDEKKNEHA